MAIIPGTGLLATSLILWTSIKIWWTGFCAKRQCEIWKGQLYTTVTQHTDHKTQWNSHVWKDRSKPIPLILNTCILGKNTYHCALLKKIPKKKRRENWSQFFDRKLSAQQAGLCKYLPVNSAHGELGPHTQWSRPSELGPSLCGTSSLHIEMLVSWYMLNIIS